MKVVRMNRSGFALLEMVAVMMGFLILMTISAATLVGVFKVQQVVAAAHQDLVDREALAASFRADVAAASAAPESVGEQKASSTCLILRTSNGGHLVYQWHDGELRRSDLSGSKPSLRKVSVGRGITGVEFTREGSEGRLITLRLTESLGHGIATRQSTVAATLGGDLR